MKASLVNPSLSSLNLAAPGGAKPRETPGAGFARQVSEHIAAHVPPAKAARAALLERADLADRPFGAIVSLLARHQDLPPAAEPEPTPAEPPADEEVETAAPPADNDAETAAPPLDVSTGDAAAEIAEGETA